MLGRKQEPWRTNLGGTENVLEFAAATSIAHLHYVSTAYVCGVRDTVVMESELDVDQTFRNDYESSKFDAEKLVAAAEHFETKTIYRPAVIVGDSQTGFTSTYHGMFLYLRLLSTLIPLQQKDENGIYQTPIKLPMNGDEPRNLVPVDWVSSVICHLVKTKSAHGRTFHLVPDECSTTRMFVDACCEYFNSGGVEYMGEGERVGESRTTKHPIRILTKRISISSPGTSNVHSSIRKRSSGSSHLANLTSGGGAVKKIQLSKLGLAISLSA